MQVITGTQMKKIDQLAISVCGISGLFLMETAGRVVFEEIIRDTAMIKSPAIVLICGPGNNGGDGYVVARMLLNAGVNCLVYSTVHTSVLMGDAAINYERYRQAGGTVLILSNNVKEKDLIGSYVPYQHLINSLDQCDLIVDAILGTGVSRPVDGISAETIDIINASGIRIASVDIPSGISGDDGCVYGTAVKASKTITFQAPKLGCVIYPGADYCGELIVRSIGIPEELISDQSEQMHLIDRSHIETLIKPRQKNTHKGSFGKVMIFAGSKGMAGAAALCARGALRSGAGLVKVAVTPEITDIVQMLVPEAICVSRKDLGDLAEAYETIVIGPGLGQDAMNKTYIKDLLKLDAVVVLDADGLNIMGDEIDQLRNAKAKLILTPHPGEAARLLGCSTQEINRQRVEMARKLSQYTKAFVVLKGAATIVATPEGVIHINTTGNPGMATAGSGDVLSGAIAALAAQGLSPEHAALAGVYLHGLAGDIMSEQFGEYGLIASDLAVGMGMAIHAVIQHKS
jgi:hydroxyethylthiazole kinase-like uncharacterized protein yjeF